MKKLYRFNEGKNAYFYDEAWLSGEEIIEHVGQVGHRGRTVSHPIDPALSEEVNLLRVLGPGLRGGFDEVPMEKHKTLIIEYEVDGHGNPADLDKRHSVEQQMNETPGWTGLGHCDGGSIGSGSMEVCCFVVDFEVAKRVIEDDLRGTDFANYSRIYEE